MEKLDQEMQKRVWQRVQGTAPEAAPPRENLKAWLMLAGENTAAYHHLARRMGGTQGEQLQRLEQQSRHWTACAKGMCRLRGEEVKLFPAQPTKEPPRRILEKCWHREQRLWREAKGRDTDPECGAVYGRLAEQALERCMSLLELLGTME